jgi:hypothetical protein
MGKFLILSGIILIVAGLIIQFSDKIPHLGKLPGDIQIERSHFSFYFPIVTSIVISVILSLILFIINKVRQ